MKKAVRLLAVMVILAMLTVLAVGCGSNSSTSASTKETQASKEEAKPQETKAEAPKAEEPKKEISIGFVPMTLDNEYFITMVNAAKQEAQKQNVMLKVQAGSSHGAAEEQLQIVEGLISAKVNAICIVPSSSEGIMTALKKAQDGKIPVVNLDTKINADLLKKNGINPVPFIGTNNYDGAKIAGEYALKILGGKGNVAILTGIAGQQNATDRRNGFADAVKDKLKVVAEQSADWDVDKGYAAAQNIIQAHPEIVMIFASNDNMGLGAYRAVKEAGKDIKVIGYDAVNEALNSIKQGAMAATVAQFPAEMGIKGVQAAVKLINGGTVDEITYTETRLITKENVDDFQKYLAQFK